MKYEQFGRVFTPPIFLEFFDLIIVIWLTTWIYWILHIVRFKIKNYSDHAWFLWDNKKIRYEKVPYWVIYFGFFYKIRTYCAWPLINARQFKFTWMHKILLFLCPKCFTRKYFQYYWWRVRWHYDKNWYTIQEDDCEGVDSRFVRRTWRIWTGTLHTIILNCRARFIQVFVVCEIFYCWLEVDTDAEQWIIFLIFFFTWFLQEINLKLTVFIFVITLLSTAYSLNIFLFSFFVSFAYWRCLTKLCAVYIYPKKIKNPYTKSAVLILPKHSWTISQLRLLVIFFLNIIVDLKWFKFLIKKKFLYYKSKLKIRLINFFLKIKTWPHKLAIIVIYSNYNFFFAYCRKNGSILYDNIKEYKYHWLFSWMFTDYFYEKYELIFLLCASLKFYLLKFWTWIHRWYLYSFTNIFFFFKITFFLNRKKK